MELLIEIVLTAFHPNVHLNVHIDQADLHLKIQWKRCVNLSEFVQSKKKTVRSYLIRKSAEI